MFMPTASTNELADINKRIEDLSSEDRKNVSDGHHSFDDLYDYRCAYNAAFFNMLSAIGKYEVHKSYKHSDGEPCFGKDDMFVVTAQLPTGQVSNHYKKEKWDLFACEERERADEWDGHDPDEALKRIEAFCSKFNKLNKDT